MNTSHSVVILDFGSQYTQLIARRVRELSIHSEVIAGSSDLKRLQALAPGAILLSGGPSSVTDSDAPTVPPGFWEWIQVSKTPVLGICYGMQLMAHQLGGRVHRAPVKEYGRMKVSPQGSRILPKEGFQAWMSHGDEIERMPEGFTLSAQSASGSPAAMECPEKKMYALQFHPEVAHTEQGAEILRAFLLDVAGLPPTWNSRSVLDLGVHALKEQIPPTEHVICALSGGVDSTVAATLVHRAIGDRLHCIFVDHGLLRKNERHEVEALFHSELHLPVQTVDASARFLKALEGVSDPEAKRKIIGAEFIAVFEEESQRLAMSLGRPIRFLVQGTLYPDVIESSPPPSSLKALGQKKSGHHATKIKSHHNVGGLPEDLRFELVEPLRDLFKDEVRALGRELGVPPSFLSRHPFPGPGLAVRIPGAITREQIQTLQEADHQFIQALKERGLYDQIWQAFAVLLPVKSVGVQGDGRTHSAVVSLRAVTSSDGMTADAFPFEPRFLSEVATRICNAVPGVNRVLYDVTSKPPSTIEWE